MFGRIRHSFLFPRALKLNFAARRGLCPLRCVLGGYAIAANSVVLSLVCVQFVCSAYPQSTKTASNTSKICGMVLPLDKAGMQRLDLVKRLATIPDSVGFTETDYVEASREETDNLIASSYFLAYLTLRTQKL